MNNHNYTVIQGETLIIYSIWYDLDGNVVDLTGWTGSLYIYDRNGTGLATIPLTLSNVGEIEGSAASDAWSVGTYEYYLRLTSPASEVVDLYHGKVCVE